MKKNYIKPTTETTNIEAETLICISVIGDKKADNSTVLSKSRDFDFMDEAEAEDAEW